MSTEKHTPEPWSIGGRSDIIETADYDPIANGAGENAAANAHRIVSCVNALAGIPDPEAAIRAAREALEGAEEVLRRHDLKFDADECAKALALLGKQ